MYDEIDYHKDCENKEVHAQVVAEVAAFFGLGPDVPYSRIEKAVYRGTDCGAWVKFSMREHSVTFGSIVEGADAEATPVTLQWPFGPCAIEDALQAVENSADEIWHEWNGA